MLSIAILCGGKSKRFGSDKIFYKINGKTILEIVYEKFHNFTDDIFLQMSKSNKQNNKKELSTNNTKKYHDEIENKGPLGGIYSALQNSRYNRVFIIAGDLPFIDEKIFNQLQIHKSHSVIVPRWENGFIEPLCAIYSKTVIPVIEHQLNRNDCKINNLYHAIELNETLKIKYVDIKSLLNNDKINPDCFRNINTIEDLNSSTKNE